MRHTVFTLALASLLSAQDSTLPLDPPPVDEAALAARLVEMTKPAADERAVIVFDPTYYPGITSRLREALHAAGVHTSTIVEDTPAMIASYIDDDAAGARREREIVETWRPVFQRSDIFYWMPTRGYGDDLRWEILTAESAVRSVHFHWMLRFPGGRSAEEIAVASRSVEARALNVDLAEHARNQRQLAAALRGTTVRLTTPAGTDLTVGVRRDEWFHRGNGDASKAATTGVRWLRDRQLELPVGMFQFVPDPETVSGTIVAPTINQSGGKVQDARLRITNGRITEIAAASGADWIRERIAAIGPDGDRIGLINLNTNPFMSPSGLGIDIGANWENGATNRAHRMRRMTIWVLDASLTADGRPLVRDGRWQWEELARVPTRPSGR